jgi:hypothetical protein
MQDRLACLVARGGECGPGLCRSLVGHRAHMHGDLSRSAEQGRARQGMVLVSLSCVAADCLSNSAVEDGLHQVCHKSSEVRGNLIVRRTGG